MASRLPIIQPQNAFVPELPPELRGDGRTVHFVSLGCPKNRTDTEAMIARLGQAGFGLAADPDEADVIVVNSCTFIDASTQESIDTVLEMADFKQSGRASKLVVTGCMAQRHHDELRTELPEVDAFIGTGDYHRIVEVVADGAHRGIVGEPTYVQGAEARVNTLTPWSAYLKILEGCPQRCTFCIIPKLRGDLMSRPLDTLVREAEALVAAGVKELNLVGQDSNAWGRDLPGKPTLPDLLRALDGVSGLRWVRLLYSYPAKFNEPLIDTIAELSTVVPYIDMPLQHISDPILKAMRRGVSRARTERLLTTLRERIDGVSIRTGFIVGFPGETPEQFDELKGFLAEQRFDNVGVFAFSPQDETPAAHLPGQLPDELKQARREELMLLQQDIHAQKSEEQVGRIVDVLIEGTHPESELLLVGRTPNQAPEVDGCVLISDAGDHVPGDIVPMRVTEAAGYDIVAQVLDS